MQASKILFGARAVFLSTVLLAGFARGGDLRVRPVGRKTNAPPPITVLSLNTQLRQETVPGFPSVTRVVASAGTNQFAFLAPRGFRVDASNPKKIVLISSNQFTFVAVRALAPLPSADSKKSNTPLREHYRELLLKEHPGSKILSEFTRAADGRQGPAFDLQWMVAGAFQSARVVFVPTALGMLEFTLGTRPDLFHAATYKFNNVLLSFRASKNGRLELTPLSNKF